MEYDGTERANTLTGYVCEVALETHTIPDDDGHCGLLHDGAYPGKSREAAVVSAAVLLHGIREIQVPVEAHGNPLILLDVLQTWVKRSKEWAGKGATLEQDTSRPPFRSNGLCSVSAIQSQAPLLSLGHCTQTAAH